MVTGPSFTRLTCISAPNSPVSTINPYSVRRISLNSVNGKVDANKIATISVNIGILNTQQLDFIVDKIKQIPDVYSVRRVIS